MWKVCGLLYWIDGVELHLVCITRFISIINFYFTLEESSETESRCISNACAMSRYILDASRTGPAREGGAYNKRGDGEPLDTTTT